MTTMHPLRGSVLASLGIVVLAAAWGCSDDAAGPLCDDDASSLHRPAWWTRASHCPQALPDYAQVFDTGRVARFDLKVSAADYEASVADVYAVFEENKESDLDAVRSPVFVPVTVQHNGQTWTWAGMRYKGHASLRGALKVNGYKKLSFVLDFSKYEREHPEVADQRFFGFHKLVFSNAYLDASLIREKTAGGIFRAAGVPAVRSSFAAVYLDKGDASGPVYMGLYTMMEDAPEWMLAVQLGNGAGNLYKPWGEAARWPDLGTLAEGALAEHWEKQTNEEGDWSDATDAIAALHADRTDAATWRANLDKVIDVSGFLRTLAVNQVMLNWDSYGCMHHNYLVYANPLKGGAFLWLPWDMNESMTRKDSGMCVSAGAAAGSVMLEEVTGDDEACEGWPLICYVLRDETYRTAYASEVARVLKDALPYDTLLAQMKADHELIKPYVVGPTAVETYPYTTLNKDPATAAAMFADSIEGTDGIGTLVKARQTEVPAALAAAGY